MDYIYSELDPNAIDFSNCLIYHDYKDLPDPDESNYKRIAFITTEFGSEAKSDAMLICLKINDEYTWVNALDSGVDDEVIRILSEKIKYLEETKADSSEVDEEIERILIIISRVKEELIERISDVTAPLIVNVSREDSSESEYGYILTLDKTWNEINDAYELGKNVLGKVWPEWETEALYYPPRALYPFVGVGQINPETYAVYTGDGTFTTDDPDGYPVISKKPGEGELVPVTIESHWENNLVYLSADHTVILRASADYGSDYEVEWQSSAIDGEITDFLYIQSGNTLTVV